VTPSTATLVRRSIRARPLGEPFSSIEVLGCGSRVAVDHALSRFARDGFITRVARGVYVRPRHNPHVGEVAPGVEAVVRAAARRTGAKVQVAGAGAAAELRLTTQHPLVPVFSTTGPSRQIRMGALEVRLEHATGRRMMLAGRPAGTALAALWYLGKGEVSEAVVRRIQESLPSVEFRALRAAMPVQPAWMAEVFRRFDAGLHRA
jgi:hypothetical protein